MHPLTIATRFSAAALLIAASAADTALAHSGPVARHAFIDGALHPLHGPDHVAAMVAVGLWAASVGGKRLWVWPLAFVTAMLAGGIAAHMGIVVPAVESAIAASVIVLGLLVASGVSLSVTFGAILIAAFALAHGHAHGLEAPATGWAGYAVGFTLSTAMLHGVGIVLALAISRFASRLPMRTLGLATASLGAVLLLRLV